MDGARDAWMGPGTHGWGPGRVDGARDMWMGPGTHGWGPGRMDGARDAWMGPGTRGWGPGRVDGAQDAWEGVECALLSWWSTRGGRVLTVGTNAGSTRDMPMHVVHNESERQDTDKGGYARQGMYTESLRVDALGFCGQGVTVDEGRLWQGEGSRRANAIGKLFALCKACTCITLLKRANSISHANVHETG